MVNMSIPAAGTDKKPRIAVHKFSSCDGCQLAFLNLGEDLLTLAGLVDIIHFAEAGYLDPEAPVDIAFVEGSISSPEESTRIDAIRKNSRYLVTMGACATAGGLQALRNFADTSEWMAAIYATPEHIHSLEKVSPIAALVKVDLELWGCPVNSRQLLAAVRSLLFGIAPREEQDKVCLECKRQQTVCVMVTKQTACMGPVTRTGCGAICPQFGRGCYGCFGPTENINTDAYSRHLLGLGLQPEEISRRFHLINNHAPAFLQAGLQALQRT